MSERLKLNLHFGGGAELLFDNIKKREVELPPLKRYSADGWMTEKWTVKELLVWIKENLLRKRPELFLQGDSVGPDIDVQINDIPLELCGELDYELQENDTVMFMFTSHRGKIWH